MPLWPALRDVLLVAILFPSLLCLLALLVILLEMGLLSWLCKPI
ncbi:MAG TPA: hypothetical protein VHP11_08850 [Tepidisphaeraceae bacterium]|nr:hypothetical protein [Tepidisphaeraceae bacterium]